MASTTLADVSAALSIIYGRALQTQINSVAVLLFLIPTMFGSGKALFWTVEFTGAADAVASAEGVQRDATDADAEAEVPATLPWAQYDKVASVTGLSEAAAGTNYNPASIGTVANSLLMGRVQTQCRRLGLGLARDMYAGNVGASPPQLAGAALAIDSSGIFATIDPGTYPEWSSVEDSIPLLDLSFSEIRSRLFTPIYNACGENPEWCTCPPEIFDKIRDLFGDNELNVIREIRLSRGGGIDGEEPRLVKLEAGLQMFAVDGVTFVKDRHATANTIYAWHSQYFELQQLPPPSEDILRSGMPGVTELFRRATENSLLVPSREEVEGAQAKGDGPMPHVKMLGARGDSTEAMVLVYLQLCWKRRNAFGKLTLT